MITLSKGTKGRLEGRSAHIFLSLGTTPNDLAWSSILKGLKENVEPVVAEGSGGPADVLAFFHHL